LFENFNTGRTFAKEISLKIKMPGRIFGKGISVKFEIPGRSVVAVWSDHTLIRLD
jgi:hypothetical protein